MANDLEVGQGDIADASIRRLIEPDSLRLLDGLALRDRYVSAVWARGVPIAAVGARIDRAMRQAEIVSLGCLSDFRMSSALGIAVRDLSGVMTGTGLSVAFDPREPTSDHITGALSTGGMSPCGAEWLWFQFQPDGVAATRATVRQSAPANVRPLSELTGDQLAVVLEGGGHVPHPDDIPDCSPVVLGEDGRPIGFVILRRSQPGSVVHWSWVDPHHRRQGVILIAGDALFRMLERRPQAAPLRFRVKATNGASRHLVAGALATAVTPLFTTRTWKAQPPATGH